MHHRLRACSGFIRSAQDPDIHGWMATGIRQTIVTFGMPDTIRGLRTTVQLGLALAMKGSSFMRAIGREMTAGMTMIIAGIGTVGIGTITGTTTVMAKARGDRAQLLTSAGLTISGQMTRYGRLVFVKFCAKIVFVRFLAHIP